MNFLSLLIFIPCINIALCTSSTTGIWENEERTTNFESETKVPSRKHVETKERYRSKALRDGHKDGLQKEKIDKRQGINSFQSFRNLQGHDDISQLKCNEIIEQISPDHAPSRFIEILNDNFSPKSAAYTYFSALGANMINYGVEVRKVCASCKTLLSETTNHMLKNKDFESFCGEDVYGYDAVYSGLLLIPLIMDGQDSKNLLKKPGLSPGFIFSRPSLKTTYDEPPSESWGVNKKSGRDIIFTFLAATSGYVTIAPDFMGYGESSNRSLEKRHFLKKTYLTSAVPLWLETGMIIEKETRCNSSLADASVFGGYEEGGYASLVLADGMNKALNLDVMKIEAGGTAYDIPSSLEHLVHIMSKNVFSAEAEFWLSKITSTYSNSNPSDRLEENTSAIQDFLALLNPEIVTETQSTTNSTVKFCSLKNKTLNEQICDRLKKNSLNDILRNASYKIQLCHSTRESLFSFNDLPPFDINPKFVDFSIYTGQGQNDDSLMCSLSLISYLHSDEAKSFSLDRKNKECAFYSHRAAPSNITSSSSNSAILSSYIYTISFLAFLAVSSIELL